MVSLKDIAERAGVSRATVCYALKGHPKISRETRLLVERTAAELGYQPDPVLSMAASRQWQRRAVPVDGNLAFLTEGKNSGDYYAGASRRAEQLGYSLDRVQSSELGQSTKRATTILQNRGVIGVVLGQIRSEGFAWSLDWEQFAVVGCALGYGNVPYDVVRYDQHDAMRRAFQKLRDRGYRRIGFVTHAADPSPNDALVESAYLFAAERAEGLRGILPVYRRTGNAWVYHRSFAEWMKAWQPDAIIFNLVPASLLALLSGRGLGVPDDLGVISLRLRNREERVSGFIFDAAQLGALAIDYLDQQLHRHQRGLHPLSHHMVIRMEWWEGDGTLGDQPPIE